jgi:hypothetical protein
VHSCSDEQGGSHFVLTAASAVATGAEGLLLTDWGDNGHVQVATHNSASLFITLAMSLGRFD